MLCDTEYTYDACMDKSKIVIFSPTIKSDMAIATLTEIIYIPCLCYDPTVAE